MAAMIAVVSSNMPRPSLCAFPGGTLHQHVLYTKGATRKGTLGVQYMLMGKFRLPVTGSSTD